MKRKIIRKYVFRVGNVFVANGKVASAKVAFAIVAQNKLREVGQDALVRHSRSKAPSKGM